MGRCAPEMIARAATAQPATTTVLVTGGGGFLGRAIVERLLAAGIQVRSFSRGDYPELRSQGVHLIRGDLTDADAVKRACTGCDVVLHVAARPGVWGPRRDYYQTNVIGTQHVLSACRAASVRRLVYTSTPSVIFSKQPIEGADETLPYPRRFGCHYAATKAHAEQLVLTANSPELRTLSLRPHLIWGPGDNHLIPRLVARARAGRLRRVGDGRNLVDTTYVDNAADAHLLAAEALNSNPRASGRAYFISNGEPWRLWKIIDALLQASGAPRIRAAIGHRTAWLTGALLEAAHALLRRQDEPLMTRFVADQLALPRWFDISAARIELGYQPRVSIGEGLERLKEWCTSHTQQSAANP